MIGQLGCQERKVARGKAHPEGSRKQIDQGGRKSPACRGGVTQASPGLGGEPTPDVLLLFPSPHLPLETPSVNFSWAPQQGRGAPIPPPLWRPTGAFLRPQSLPSGLPPHLQLVGTGPPPSAGLASSNNLATLLCINPPELEAQDAGRVDESLFLQSQREVRRRGSAPPPPGQTRPVHMGCQACCGPSSGPPSRSPTYFTVGPHS